MSPTQAIAANATREARQAATSSKAEVLYRLGYAAKGIVYVLVGWLAMLAALGSSRGATTDTHGAILTIHEQPLGRVLVGAVAIGLLGYGLWKLVRALIDPERRGTEPKALVARLSDAVGAVSYLGLAVVAARLFLGAESAGKGSDALSQDWTARLLGLPFGPLLVVAVGVCVLGAAAFQLKQAWSEDFLEQIDLGRIGSRERQWIERFGRVGFAARGVVFALVGVFFILAALREDPGQAIGLSGALERLSEQPYGVLLLGVVAVGLITYGLFSLAEARFGHLPTAS